MVILFFLELIILFFLSRQLTRELSFLFHRVVNSQRITVFLMSLLFLPGTIIHEFSHAIMAKILFVPVGRMSLMPSIDGQNLKLGSVEVGKADAIRNFLIGIAPFLVGTIVLLGILYYAYSSNLLGFSPIAIAIYYLTFTISNTMYSSRKDMEGAIEFILLIIIPIVGLYLLGVRIPGASWAFLDAPSVQSFFKTACILLGFPLIIDCAIVLFGKIVNK